MVGVLTRRNLLDTAIDGDASIASLVQRPALAVHERHTLREAADHMVEADVGRLVVLDGVDGGRMVGFITRGDLLAAHAPRLREARDLSRHLTLGRSGGPRR